MTHRYAATKDQCLICPANLSAAEAELSPVDHPVHFQLPVCCYRSDNMRQLTQTQ